MANTEEHGKLRFLDSFVGIFRRKTEPEESQAEPPQSFEDVRARFDTALKDLEATIETHRQEMEGSAAARGSFKEAGAESEEHKIQRMASIHRQIRVDVEAMHAQLGTGISGSDIDELNQFLQEVAELSAGGEDSHELLGRARFTILRRLSVEAGELAVSRLRDLMNSADMTWPETLTYHPSTSPEGVARIRERHLAELKEYFLQSGIERMAQFLVGIVPAWKEDYPHQGSPIWDAVVLKAVAAGIRASLLKEFVEKVREDRAAIEEEVEELIGAELSAVDQCLKEGIDSIQDANRVVAGTMRILDEVVPDLAWERVHAALPRARGDWSD